VTKTTAGANIGDTKIIRAKCATDKPSAHQYYCFTNALCSDKRKKKIKKEEEKMIISICYRMMN
jgi:hypothetical protein